MIFKLILMPYLTVVQGGQAIISPRAKRIENGHLPRNCVLGVPPPYRAYRTMGAERGVLGILPHYRAYRTRGIERGIWGL